MHYFPPVNGNLLDPDRPYINANPGLGIEGSWPHAKAIEGSMREIVNVIVTAGLAPDDEDFTQLEQAIAAMIAASTPTDLLPIGTEIMWQKATIPSGWLEQNGASFSAITYPGLAAHLGSTTLPDMRGEFVRGWDNGRGIDGGRVLGSAQTDEFKAHDHWSGADVSTPYQNGASPLTGTRYGSGGANPFYTFTGSTGGTETRPRNKAKIFLIKAL